MPKLYSSNEVISVLKKHKFEFVSQKGSHGKFRNPAGRVAIVSINKKEIPMGTFRSIIKQSGIEQKYFLEGLK